MSEALSGQLQAHCCETRGSQVRETEETWVFARPWSHFSSSRALDSVSKEENVFHYSHCSNLLLLFFLFFIQQSLLSKPAKDRRGKKQNKTLPPKHNNKKQKSHQTKTHQGTTRSLPSCIVHCDILSPSLHLPLLQQKQHLLLANIFSEVNLFLTSLQELPKMVIIINNEIWLSGASKLL